MFRDVGLSAQDSEVVFHIGYPTSDSGKRCFSDECFRMARANVILGEEETIVGIGK